MWTCCELCWDNKIVISLLTKLPASEIWPEFREWKVDRFTQRGKRCTEKHIIISNLLDWPHSMITTHYSVLALIYTGPWWNLQPGSKKVKQRQKCLLWPVFAGQLFSQKHLIISEQLELPRPTVLIWWSKIGRTPTVAIFPNRIILKMRLI